MIWLSRGVQPRRARLSTTIQVLCTLPTRSTLPSLQIWLAVVCDKPDPSELLEPGVPPEDETHAAALLRTSLISESQL